VKPVQTTQNALSVLQIASDILVFNCLCLVLGNVFIIIRLLEPVPIVIRQSTVSP